ncbi:MAG: DUF1028 domain-containing protein [Bacteroidota bacterium]
MKSRFLLVLAVFFPLSLYCQQLNDLASTFSIVALDPATGEFGVGVQSHWFSVGQVVPWAEAGVGAVATQSFVEVSYGPKGLGLMKQGKTASDALEELLNEDSLSAVRQVAMIDAKGSVATHTGASCISYAGHRTGKNYSVQGNLLASPMVWEEMAKAFENTTGSLADRILAALEAGQAAGGDARGRQSAALIVVRQVSDTEPWKNRVVDLRVEDSISPIKELRRVYDLHRAYEWANKGDEHFAEKDYEKALQAYNMALSIVPENDELIFWRGSMYMQMGKREEAVRDVQIAVNLNPRWRILLERLPDEIFPAAKWVATQLR